MHLKDGGIDETVLQRTEGSASFRRPGKRLLDVREASEWSHLRSVVVDKPPIEVGKPQEALQLLPGVRDEPVDGSGDFGS